MNEWIWPLKLHILLMFSFGLFASFSFCCCWYGALAGLFFLWPDRKKNFITLMEILSYLFCSFWFVLSFWQWSTLCIPFCEWALVKVFLFAICECCMRFRFNWIWRDLRSTVSVICFKIKFYKSEVFLIGKPIFCYFALFLFISSMSSVFMHNFSVTLVIPIMGLLYYLAPSAIRI